MRTKILPSILACFMMLSAYAQKPKPPELVGITGSGAIATAAPFLMISPDARAGAMGDIGAATSSDPYSQHWNPAKYAFLENDLSLSLTYSPWLMNLSNDMALSYLTAAKKLDDKNTIAFSLLYFNLGRVDFRSSAEDISTPYNPHEFSIDASYSRLLTDELSIAVAGRYIYSNLTLGQMVGGISTKAGQAGAADIALFYNKPLSIAQLQESKLSIGLNISNIGSKLSYTDDNTKKDFLPTNLRFGLGFEMKVDDYNSIAFFGEINKLLVPSTPIYNDSTGEIIAGKDNNVGVITGMIQSFYDAPYGFKEEMQEIAWSLGAEYWYNKLISFRAGYFHESVHKGARQYVTLGAGIRYSMLGLDFSYLIPTTPNVSNHPLKNTLRFSLTIDMNTGKKAKLASASKEPIF